MGPQERGDLFQPFEQRMTREPGPVQVRGKAAAGALRSWFVRGRVNADAGVAAADAAAIALGKSEGGPVACRGDPGGTAAGDIPARETAGAPVARWVDPGVATTQRAPAGEAAGVPGGFIAKTGSGGAESGGERESAGRASLHGAELLGQGDRGGSRGAEGDRRAACGGD